MANKIITLKKGEELFLEGDTPEAMYVIKKGGLEITKKKGNNSIILAELKTGELVGEMTFFDKSPRSAGARASINGAELIELPFSALEQQWQNLPSWVKSMVKSVNGHLHQANTRIRRLEKTQEEENEVFSSHTINRLMSILGFVSIRYGEKTDEGYEVAGNTLRNYTIQVFQEATHKMNKMCEVLADLGYMNIKDLGEGQMQFITKDVDFIFHFVEFYNNQLFSEKAKKYHVSRHRLETLKVVKHYSETLSADNRGFAKLDIGAIMKTSVKEMGSEIDIESIKDLSNNGLLGEYSSDGTNEFVEFEVEHIRKIVPFWVLVYTLKSFTRM